MSIIRARDIQLETYDYIMFVDAAGDDGILFEERKSSKTYVVACFVINSSQLNIYNDLLDQLKRIVGANVNQEVKSTAEQKMCIAVIPKSMGPGFNAICCPKHKHCQNNKKQK